ncbi:hypothetical protein ACIOHC_24170 [Streptomyces sp. NPDC088252]|uniref:hypothetical protein n=1 Tax=unclassified Streptomyces TaxID=2593676 RepID=UPI00380FA5D0
MYTRATIAVLAAALLTLTACSSSNDDKPTAASSSSEPSTKQPTTPSLGTEDGPEEAVIAYTAAYFKGDATTAYEILSKRCQGKVGLDAYAGVVKQAAADYGNDHPATNVKANVSGDMARVTYKVNGLPKFDQEAQPWAREGGAWRYDAC